MNNPRCKNALLLDIVDKGLMSGLDFENPVWSCIVCKKYREAMPYADVVISQKDGEVKSVRVEMAETRKSK